MDLDFDAEFLMPDTIPEKHKLSSPGLLPASGTDNPLMDTGAGIWVQWGVAGDAGCGGGVHLQPYQAFGSSTVSSQLVVTGKENKLLCLARKDVLPVPGSSSLTHNLNFNWVSELWS